MDLYILHIHITLIMLYTRYMFDSAASPLMKVFVESKDAFCADAFYAIETFRVGYLEVG
jgi:hypothetical protein